MYHNTEIRTELGDLESILLPASFGVNAFFDEGRVWADNQSSRIWHYGYGGGVWISPLDRFVVSGNYAMSENNQLVSFTLGFTF